MDFATAVHTLPGVLTEGAVIERLRRDPAVRLDPHLLHAGMIYEPLCKVILERIYRQYLDVGCEFKLPMLVCTPTWRAGPDRLAAAGFGDIDLINRDGFRFLAAIRKSYGRYADYVYVGGLTGCRGDAYRPEEALPEDEAAAYHRPQMRALAGAGVDFLLAATLPALNEAAGIARAMAECSVPYILSFPLRPSGTLLDGTPLHEAVSRVDSTVDPPPFGYMVNCVHPTVFADAMACRIGGFSRVAGRVLGLQANTSTLSPEELDNLDHVDEAEDPQTFAEAMWAVRQRFGLKILGGCCGTDERHIRAVAARMAQVD